MQVAIIIVVLLLSGFFSGSETIFLSANKIKLEALFHKGVKGTKFVQHFISKPESFIITTILGNTISLVVYSSVFAIYMKQQQYAEVVVILLSSMIALLFAEIIPKAIGWELSNRLIFKVALPLKFFHILFTPLNWMLNKISSFLLKLFRMKENENIPFFTKKDVEIFIRESENAGIVAKEEREIISKVFNLRETRLKETCVPRTEIVAIKKNASINTVIKTFEDSGFSRLPVYDKNIDNIIGVVHAKDLFKHPNNLNEITYKTEHVPETKNAFNLLQEFRKTNTSIAIVLDEYGGTAGLVTFEDLVEELFGEIYDEFDLDREHLFKKLNAFTLLVQAKAEIDELNSKFQLNIPEGDYTTIGGFVIDRLGKIPRQDEKIELVNCKIVVAKATRKKVVEVKIIKLQRKDKFLDKN